MNGGPDEVELAARLRLVVGRLSRRIRIDGRESLPPLQLSALVTVEEREPLRLSELARREGVSVPTMSRVLTALDEQGLVVRMPDPQDARGVLVRLSEAGEQRLAQVRSHRTALVARRLERLDARSGRRWSPRCRRSRRCWSTSRDALCVSGRPPSGATRRESGFPRRRQARCPSTSTASSPWANDRSPAMRVDSGSGVG